MADCEYLKGCLFFNDEMLDNTGLGAIYKEKYCQRDNAKCARYLIAKKLGPDKVSANLYPNMYDQAFKLSKRDEFHRGLA
jgi:hypothetical protein